MKTVLVESQWKQRQASNLLVRYPCAGYRFITLATKTAQVSTKLSRLELAYYTHWALMKLLPINLLKARWDSLRERPRADLIWASLHPVAARTPWILDMQCEEPYLLIGSEATFERWKWLLRPMLQSPYCRKIVFELEAGRKAFMQWTGWKELEQKAVVLHAAVPQRGFRKIFRAPADGRLKLLFVNSANINMGEHFYGHGGAIAVAAFLKLRRTFPNLELVIRSGVPARLKQTLEGIENLRIIDKPIPWIELEAEFKTADIFIYPTHVTPSMVFLDAMSYELPIVTTDVWGNPELVQDGETGLLVHHPRAHEYTEKAIFRPDSAAIRRVKFSVDPELVDGVAERIRLLIEHPDLRRRMGEAGRRQVEEGDYSMGHRMSALGKVLDAALANAP